MKRFFASNVWNTFLLFIIGIIAFISQELASFFMLGFVLIMLSNIYDKLNDISQKLDK